jgi:hypothetical protein
MAWELPIWVESYEAGEDLSNDQYRFVILSGGKVCRPNATTDKSIGILQNNPESGEEASVMRLGTSKLVAGETIAENEYVKLEYIDAADAGKGLDADTALDLASAMCIEGGDEDDLITVSVWPFPFQVNVAS